jgi:predicted aspartyl protease
MLIEALVDTGFDGDVVLPAGTVTAAPDFETTWRLADGSRVRSSTYVAEVELRRLSGSYPVMASVLGDEFFVGRGLTDRFLLVLDHGRQLTVEA